MSQTQQNTYFLYGQKHLSKKRRSFRNRRIVGFDNQHNQINTGILQSLAENKLLRLGKAICVNIDFFQQLKRFLEDFKMLVASHNFINYVNMKAGKDIANYQNGGVVKRGGNWNNTTAAGVFARNNNWATNGNTNNGARLARYLALWPDCLGLRSQAPRRKDTAVFSPAPACLGFKLGRAGVKIGGKA